MNRFFWVTLALGACEPAATPPTPEPRAASKGGAPDVVLISLDTTRADALSVYGASGPAGSAAPGAPITPRLDQIARSGVRFLWAFTHAPTTLSSHASVFTGYDPHGHRVARNGFPLDPNLPTLAERFAAAGYQTIGVIGSSALAAETGISRGFSVWDAELNVDRRVRHEARADQVTDRALQQVAARDGRPLFLFVHYFDAHGPYDPPAPFDRRYGAPGYAGPIDGGPEGVNELVRRVRAGENPTIDRAELWARYLGEVAWVDQELGRLMDGAFAGTRPITVVFGDHGEHLGEPGFSPVGHGQDVDLVASHVPLLIAGPGVPVAEVPTPVALSDVGSTVWSVVQRASGANPAERLGEGQDLSAGWSGAGALAPRPVFLEATQPGRLARREGWPNLNFQRGVVDESHLWLTAPLRPETAALYRLEPGQPRVEDPERAARLAARLAAWDRSAPSGSGGDPWLSAEQREALEALGYAD